MPELTTNSTSTTNNISTRISTSTNPSWFSSFKARAALVCTGLALIVLFQVLELDDTSTVVGDVVLKVQTSVQAIKEKTGEGTSTEFPNTIFTPHILGILSLIENITLPRETDEHMHAGYDPTALRDAKGERPRCDWSMRIVVDKPFSPPSRIECDPFIRDQYKHDAHCVILKHYFSNNPIKVLPYNVSLGFSSGDYSDGPGGQCLSSSAPKGKFVLTNFQDVYIQGKSPSAKGFSYSKMHKLPWEQRHKKPIFRGHARMRLNIRRYPEQCPQNSADMGHRMKAALISLEHPDLLDVVLQPDDKRPCAAFNETNGMDKIFRWGKYENLNYTTNSYIPPDDYFTNYQTVLVMGGIGAAFRTARHMNSGQAIVLQDFRYEEWFTQYMTPHVHYIPLKEDLSDLQEVMEWVRDHPKEVQQIAEAGQQFYWDYLSFEKTEEHWYELLWRLSLLIQEKGSDRLKTGSGRDIWPEPRVPFVYQRNLNGTFDEVEVPPDEFFVQKLE